MERRLLTISSTLCFLLPLVALLGQHSTAQDAPAPVRVGVILDAASTAGMALQTGIRMAVDDYYAVQPNSATRVELHFRDSAGDDVQAASAAVDLMRNTQVQAIIGPQSTAEAEFVAAIGSQAHVPILSSSATSPALSPSRAPFFVRTAAADSAQAAPVAAVLGAFGWRGAVLVHEDSPDGAGIQVALDDALQGVGARVLGRAAVPAQATDDRLDAVLYRLMATPTRVFVVHTPSPLAARLFRRAASAGMMADGYVWIATAAVGGAVGALSAQDVGAMQGLVCVRPYVPVTSQASNFAARFRERFRQENPGSQDVQDPTVATLWAYDTAWAVAAAAQAAGISDPAFQFQPPEGSTTAMTELDQLGVSSTGAALLAEVLNTTFDGVAGKFRLVNGQLQPPVYEYVNVVGKGPVTVGFWTPENTVPSQDWGVSGGKGLGQIVWPGAPSRHPKGWVVSPNEWQIAVPVKRGFTQFVDVSTDAATGRQKVTGFCIDVFDTVMRELGVTNYRYVPFNDSTSYEDLIDQVVQKKADAVVGDVTITASRMDEVDFTMPFTESGWSMVVAVHKQTSSSMFFFLKPLTASLWIASCAFFCFTGFVVWVIEHRINPEFRGTPWQQFGLVFYFAFSTMVFSHNEKLESNLSKFMMVIWVFVVLILTSSYTASLTSMLTVEKLEPTVTDVNDLLASGDYVGYQEGSFVGGMLRKMNFEESRLRSYGSADEYADALSKGSAKGGVTAIFDEIPFLKVFLAQYCDGYTMVGPTYKDTGFGFVFPKGAPMVPVLDVSQEIVALTAGDGMSLIERKWFGATGACDGQGSDVGSGSLSFRNFGGLFLVTGLVSGLMLVLYLIRFVYRERREVKAAAEEENGGSMSRRMRAWLQHYDSKDKSCAKWDDGSARNGSSHRSRDPESGKPGAVHDVGSCSSNHSGSEAPSLHGEDDSREFRGAVEKRNEPEMHGQPAVKGGSSLSLRIRVGGEERKERMLSP